MYFNSMPIFLQIHECERTHCLDPPNKNVTKRMSQDPAERLIPIGEDAKYTCMSNESTGGLRYFNVDKNMTSFDITCLDDGSFEAKAWPVCYEHHGIFLVYCMSWVQFNLFLIEVECDFEPMEASNTSSRLWNKSCLYATEVK